MAMSKDLKEFQESMWQDGKFAVCSCFRMTHLVSVTNVGMFNKCDCGKTFDEMQAYWKKQFVEMEKEEADAMALKKKATYELPDEKTLGVSKAVYKAFENYVIPAFESYKDDQWDDSILGVDPGEAAKKINSEYVKCADSAAKTKYLDQFRKKSEDEVITTLIDMINAV